MKAKSKLLGIILITALIGIFASCSPEPETKYITTPCTDPTHGSSCNGDHTHIHDNCPTGGCEHNVCEALNPTACYYALTLGLKEARATRANECTTNNCKDKNRCDDKVYYGYNNKAMEFLATSGRSAHNVTYSPSPNGAGNTVFTSVGGAADYKIAPCLSAAEIAQTKQAALANPEHTR